MPPKDQELGAHQLALALALDMVSDPSLGPALGPVLGRAPGLALVIWSPCCKCLTVTALWDLHLRTKLGPWGPRGNRTQVTSCLR